MKQYVQPIDIFESFMKRSDEVNVSQDLMDAASARSMGESGGSGGRELTLNDLHEDVRDQVRNLDDMFYQTKRSVNKDGFPVFAEYIDNVIEGLEKMKVKFGMVKSDDVNQMWSTSSEQPPTVVGL